MSDSCPAAGTVVLIVTPDPSKQKDLKNSLSADHMVHTASDSLEAIQKLKALPRVDALIVDYALPNMDGGVFIRKVSEEVQKPGNIIKVLIGESIDKKMSYVGAWGGQVDYFYNRSFDPEEVRRKLKILLAQKSKEKRRIMRVPVAVEQEIRADIGLNDRVSVANISEGGMFVKTMLPEGRVLPIKLSLPGGESLELAGMVVHVDREIGGVGLKFLDLDTKSRQTLEQFISQDISPEALSELGRRYSFLRVENIVVFSDKRKIENLIETAFRSETEFTAIPSQSRIPSTLQLVKILGHRYCLFRGEQVDTRFKTSDTVFISFQVGYATYNFESIVYRIDDSGGEMQILYPRILFYSEKRALSRNEPEDNLHLEITLPEPFGTTIQGHITDISRGGVSFVTGNRDVALLTGTPIESIRIYKGDDVIRESRGEVRNILKINEGDDSRIRYGLQFGIGRVSIETTELPELQPDIQRLPQTDTEKLRSGPRRQSDLGELAKKTPRVIRLENDKGEEIVGLLDSSLPLEKEPGPVILIPPAFGKTKETLFALAQTLVENFYTRGRPISVIRFDGIRRKGESYKDPETSEPPYEMVNASLSQGASDIRAVLDWLDNNPHLTPTKVIIVTFSLAALEARLVLRDAAYRKKLDYWIACMGTPELRHLLTRVNCGLDLLEQHQLGIELGVRPVLGNLVNVDKYMEDGLVNRISSLDEARADMPFIDIPITWIYGEHDHWVKPEFIRDVMGIKAEAPREVIPIPLGHNARTSKDALQMFGAITNLVYRFLHKEAIRPRIPKKENLFFKRHAEKDRIPSRNLKNRNEYWHRYLIGEKELLGFDVLTLANDYAQLMADQAEALELRASDSLLDLGGGTGNFITFLMENGPVLPREITVADLIPEALQQAEVKIKKQLADTKKDSRFHGVCCDVEMNRYLPVKRFLQGEVASFSDFVDRIENLTIQTATHINNAYSPRLHRILRGEKLTPAFMTWLKGTFDLPEIKTIVDFNRAARYISGLDRQNPTYRLLSFSKDLKSNLRLPFRTDTYDKILMSLVLSYIYNPLETLFELKRILKPGGLLVMSSVRPDADASGLFTRLVEKVETMDEADFPERWNKQLVLNSIRSFLNDAQALVELEEAGTFDFFEQDNLISLLEDAGLDYVRTIETFGDPPQGYICIAQKRT
ncbi:MAG: PilZ domain-containing protein [Acidobacteria bacterium]|nr:PilZ domain-containing protein [Acidobacteriota bacterium]